MGAIVEREEGIPRRTQYSRIRKLALLWCIPPRDSYRFRLYRAPDTALDYVYDAEALAYHLFGCERLGLKAESLGQLQDKLRLADNLAADGIPVAATVAVVWEYRQISWLEAQVKQHGRVFCKTVSGSGGQGAFSAWSTPDGIAGQTFLGVPLPDAAAVEAAWRDLQALDGALIQPYLESHPDLAPLAGNHETLTVRFISQWESDSGKAAAVCRCLSATLEVPAVHAANGKTFYVLLPIDPETGAILPPEPPLIAGQAVRDAISRVGVAARSLGRLPGWSRLAELSYRAHARFPDIRAIAWDWVPTSSGPVLLEGNTGWGTAAVQARLGGLIPSLMNGRLS